MRDFGAPSFLILSTSISCNYTVSKGLPASCRESGGYSLVAYTQLVGVCLYVFVRSCQAARVREVMVDQVKTGLGGTTGNKGTVGISLSLGASSICFLCSHFAAGQSQVAERNNDYSEAIKKISFANVSICSCLSTHKPFIHVGTNSTVP